LKEVELEGNERSEFLQLEKFAEEEQSRHLENRGLVAAFSDICLCENPPFFQLSADRSGLMNGSMWQHLYNRGPRGMAAIKI
jgi:hypothetical protein